MPNFLQKKANKAVQDVENGIRKDLGLGMKQNNKVQPQYVQAQPVGQVQYVQAQPVQYQQQPQQQYVQPVAQQIVQQGVQIALNVAQQPQYPGNRGAGLPPRSVWGVSMRRRPGQHLSEQPPVNRTYRCCCKMLLYPGVCGCYMIGQLLIFILWCFACCTCVCWEQAPGNIQSARASRRLIGPGDDVISRQRARDIAARSTGCTKNCVNCVRCVDTTCVVPCWILNAWGDEDPDTCEECGDCCKNCC